MPLLFLEFFGTGEMLLIALVALIVFGPRKLPEIGRTIGKSLGEFKRASEDFKRTWEREVEVERIGRDLRVDRDVKSALSFSTDTSLSSAGTTANPAVPVAEASAAEPTTAAEPMTAAAHEGSVARGTTQTATPPVSADETQTPAPETDTQTSKQDWL
ncbi:MAG TPA: twin-arginine translocase TatA/TatE family subunit [Pyrinomonadaceae bacterium]|nr:twin-arginine translocase TatA/TatE family subunit [Pyrinomonadaceae bacterium]